MRTAGPPRRGLTGPAAGYREPRFPIPLGGGGAHGIPRKTTLAAPPDLPSPTDIRAFDRASGLGRVAVPRRGPVRGLGDRRRRRLGGLRQRLNMVAIAVHLREGSDWAALRTDDVCI